MPVVTQYFLLGAVFAHAGQGAARPRCCCAAPPLGAAPGKASLCLTEAGSSSSSQRKILHLQQALLVPGARWAAPGPPPGRWASRAGQAPRHRPRRSGPARPGAAQGAGRGAARRRHLSAPGAGAAAGMGASAWRCLLRAARLPAGGTALAAPRRVPGCGLPACNALFAHSAVSEV